MAAAFQVLSLDLSESENPPRRAESQCELDISFSSQSPSQLELAAALALYALVRRHCVELSASVRLLTRLKVLGRAHG